MTFRPVKLETLAKPTMEGAGVNLHRVFGFNDPKESDPFLMLDDFRNDNPKDYMAGFPWHPHRGIETITYVLEGKVEHKDSIGNEGDLLSGDVQWMTAGSGIMHQEMPSGNSKGQMHGFQLWANLPSDKKLIAPRYQDIASKDITIFGNDYSTNDGTCVRDYIHVSDLCDAHILSLNWLEKGGSSKRYNLGNGNGFSVNDVVKTAEKVTGNSITVINSSRRLGDPEILVADSELIRKELGWNPKYQALETIISHAWQWEILDNGGDL